jgi:hypothetical protein
LFSSSFARPLCVCEHYFAIDLLRMWTPRTPCSLISVLRGGPADLRSGRLGLFRSGIGSWGSVMGWAGGRVLLCHELRCFPACRIFFGSSSARSADVRYSRAHGYRRRRRLACCARG